MFKIIIKETSMFYYKKWKNKNIINSNNLKIDIIRISLYNIKYK